MDSHGLSQASTGSSLSPRSQKPRIKNKSFLPLYLGSDIDYILVDAGIISS